MRRPRPSLLSGISRCLLAASFLIAFVSPGSLRAEPIDDWFLGLFGVDSGGGGHGAPSSQGDLMEIQETDSLSGCYSHVPGDETPGLLGSGPSDPFDGGLGEGGSIVDCCEWVPEPGGSGGTTPVPEPATIVLCLLGAGVLAARRARR
jgi:hypothetical protein